MYIHNNILLFSKIQLIKILVLYKALKIIKFKMYIYNNKIKFLFSFIFN